jgi:flavin-dependent dehydrogenase
MRCWGIYDTNLLAGEMQRPALKQPLAEEMARHGFELGEYEIKGHPIRWYDPASPLSAPRVLLVGDAAGADPLFGEGISMALGYGKLAAQEISATYQHGDFSFSGYRRRVRLSSLGQTLLARWVISQVIYSFHWRWFQILLWRILKPVVVGAAWVLVLNWGRRLR